MGDMRPMTDHERDAYEDLRGLVTAFHDLIEIDRRMSDLLLQREDAVARMIMYRRRTPDELVQRYLDFGKQPPSPAARNENP